MHEAVRSADLQGAAAAVHGLPDAHEEGCCIRGRDPHRLRHLIHLTDTPYRLHGIHVLQWTGHPNYLPLGGLSVWRFQHLAAGLMPDFRRGTGWASRAMTGTTGTTTLQRTVHVPTCRDIEREPINEPMSLRMKRSVNGDGTGS